MWVTRQQSLFFFVFWSQYCQIHKGQQEPMWGQFPYPAIYIAYTQATMMDATPSPL